MATHSHPGTQGLTHPEMPDSKGKSIKPPVLYDLDTSLNCPFIVPLGGIEPP